MQPRARGLANKIREKRRLKGYTQQELADILEVHQVTVAKWETGQHKPKGEHLAELVWYLDMKLNAYEQSLLEVTNTKP